VSRPIHAAALSPPPAAPTRARERARAVTVIGAAPPLTGGAAPFNAELVTALRELGPVQFLSWTRLYPPKLHKGVLRDDVSRPPQGTGAEFTLDYCDPRSWRRALRAADAFGAEALVLPWLHPVQALPYAYLLRRAPRRMARVVICHNVAPHERVPLGSRLTAASLRQADLVVTHAPHQRDELRELDLDRIPLVTAFHPRFDASRLASAPSASAVAAERLRQGSPDLALLAYGAVRPYKGIDLAIEAMARVDPALHVKLVVAGSFWEGGQDLAAQVSRLGLERRVDLRPGYVSNEDTAVLFAVADASLLPYRSASQSGVVQLSFAHGVPVIATAVGGLPSAVRDGVDGLLCAPDDADALARAIERAAADKARLAAGVAASAEDVSFAAYARLLHEGLEAI
jgi:glycosyltransferase involved in cell wall biosynthesis